jgi:hypothetical protein
MFCVRQGSSGTNLRDKPIHSSPLLMAITRLSDGFFLDETSALFAETKAEASQNGF